MATAADIISNADVLASADAYPERNAYRALVAKHGHDELCDAYGLDRDDVNGGTYWRDVVEQAYFHGDVDNDGNLT